MYVELLIHDILVKFVVDNGATLTLVSTIVYDLIPDLYTPHLSATKSQIKSACGNYLNLRGKGSFKLDFGTKGLPQRPTSDKLSRSEKQKVKSLVQEYESLFAKTDSDLGKTSLVKHEIETGNARPFKEPPRRTPFHLSKVVKDNIDKMLENKVIEHSHSPWAAGIVLFKKKDDTYRFCVDYRTLNSVTINKDAYPLPRIDESLDHLEGNSWFSTLDCCSGYWQS
ncbi:unnamed protein product [Mytilus edulis]|uniref:Reverse transcriptase domain-containing protein n=1 Tax=Mytilus edulis TaxID=6550 RepID=A0A8S3R9V4_MYTED|nr:unnamed protein product [Mytilus edulis]